MGCIAFGTHGSEENENVNPARLSSVNRKKTRRLSTCLRKEKVDKRKAAGNQPLSYDSHSSVVSLVAKTDAVDSQIPTTPYNRSACRCQPF